MREELHRPVMRAIMALFLVLLVKLVAMLTIKGVDTVYKVVDLAVAFGVIFILLRFRLEFNRQLGISVPDFSEAQTVITVGVLLLVLLAIYGAFLPYSDLLPDGTYSTIFFILALIPVYILWSVLNRHSGRVSELLFIEERLACACGYRNPASLMSPEESDKKILMAHQTAKFCSKCGSALKGGKQ